MMAEQEKIFEIGIAMAGAISAGAYSSGVMDFLVQALESWEREKTANPHGVPNHAVVIKVITGASAGSITGALAAAALAGGVRPAAYAADQEDALPAPGTQPYRYVMPALYTAWVKRPDMASADGADLLATIDLQSRRPVVSLLDSSLLDRIGQEALAVPEGHAGSTFAPAAGGERLPYIADPLHLYMTISNLRGVPYSISFDGADRGHGMLNHGDRTHYVLQGLGARPIESAWAKDDPGTPLDVGSLPKRNGATLGPWADYLQAALASSAFPIGLAPRPLKRNISDFIGRQWPVHTELRAQIQPAWPPGFPQDMSAEFAFVNVDGGVINNEPFEFAHYTLLAANRTRNERHAEFADRAVIMIDPFPEAPDFATEDKGTDVALTSVIPRLFSALIDQARFKPEELVRALSDDIYSRFLIAPRRVSGSDGTHTPEGFAIATGLLGGFGGFLDRELRAFDYQLGRRNCQKFLLDTFGLDPANALFNDWRDKPTPNGLKLSDDQKFHYINAKGERRLRIIPLVGDAAEPVALPDWPRLTADRLSLIEKRIMERADKVVQRLTETLTTSRMLRWALRAAWPSFGRKRLREYAHLAIQQDLIRRDQHAEYQLRDDSERTIFAALSDPGFDYRTLSGLARATHLSAPEIRRVLTNNAEKIFIAKGRAPGGGDGYTLATRKPSWLDSTIDSILSPPSYG